MYRDIELAWSKWLRILQNQHEWRNTLEPMNADRNKYQAAMVAPRSRVMYKSTGQFYIRFSFQSPQIAPDIRVPAPHWPDWCKTRYSTLARSFLCLLNRSWSKHFGHLYLAAKKNQNSSKFFLKFQTSILLYTKWMSGGLHLRLPISISSFNWLTYSLNLEKSKTWYCCHSTVGLRFAGAWIHPANFYSHISSIVVRFMRTGIYKN